MIHKSHHQNIMTISSNLRTFLFYVFSFVGLIILHSIWISFRFKAKKNLPPSPRKLPIIGNLHQIGSNANHSLQALSKKHGPIMLLHFGSIPTLVASSSQVAQEIMKTQDLSFAGRPSLPIPNILMYGSNDIAFCSYGEYWRQLKSIVVVHLLSNTRVKSFRQVREKEVSLMIEMLGESSSSMVDMGTLLASLSNNIICKVAFGKTYDDVSKLVELLNRFVECFDSFSLGSYIPWLWWVDQVRGLEGKAKRVAKEIDDFLECVIKDHANKKNMACSQSQSTDDSEDLVDILLDVQRENTTGFTLQRESMKAVILDMFSAGTETTSTSLEWTISELMKNPRTMKKLQQEVTDIAQGKSMIKEEDLEKMQYLKAVIKESLRLHPPLPLLLPRISRQDVKLKGYDIPSGTQVIINAWAIGRDPCQWDKPNEFNPERFLNTSIDFKGFHFDLLPFGAGRRGCPGAQFSIVVMELALANIVYKFNFSLENGVKCEDLDMSETCGITLHRKSSLKVLPTPRF